MASSASGLTVVYGVVSTSVARLMEKQVSTSLSKPAPLRTFGGVRYFAYAVPTGAAGDLMPTAMMGASLQVAPPS